MQIRTPFIRRRAPHGAAVDHLRNGRVGARVRIARRDVGALDLHQAAGLARVAAGGGGDAGGFAHEDREDEAAFAHQNQPLLAFVIGARTEEKKERKKDGEGKKGGWQGQLLVDSGALRDRGDGVVDAGDLGGEVAAEQHGVVGDLEERLVVCPEALRGEIRARPALGGDFGGWV